MFGNLWFLSLFDSFFLPVTVFGLSCNLSGLWWPVRIAAALLRNWNLGHLSFNTLFTHLSKSLVSEHRVGVGELLVNQRFWFTENFSALSSLLPGPVSSLLPFLTPWQHPASLCSLDMRSPFLHQEFALAVHLGPSLS